MQYTIGLSLLLLGAQELVDYFDKTYITGEFAAAANPAPGAVVLRLVRPPQFPPEVWNVNAETMADGHRTNNICESWNMRLDDTKFISFIIFFQQLNYISTWDPLAV